MIPIPSRTCIRGAPKRLDPTVRDHALYLCNARTAADNEGLSIDSTTLCPYPANAGVGIA